MNGDKLSKMPQEFQSGYAVGHVDGYRAKEAEVAAQWDAFVKLNSPVIMMVEQAKRLVAVWVKAKEPDTEDENAGLCNKDVYL